MSVRVAWRRSLAFNGLVLQYLAIPLLFPLLLAIYYGESTIPFVVTIAITLGIGTGLTRLDSDEDLRSREAFLLVALAWLSVAIIGAIPFIIADAGPLSQPVNALFESMSGLTTTGATILRTF